MKNKLTNEEVTDLILSGMATADIRTKGVYAHTVKRIRKKMKLDTKHYEVVGNRIMYKS